MRAGHMAAVLALAGLGQPVVAAPAGTACMSEAELGALVDYFLPSALRGLTDRCAPALPPRAFLVTPGRALAGRLAAGRTTSWAAARAALEKATGERIPAMFGAQTGGPLAETLVSGLVTEKLQPSDCALADRLVRDLAPLPPRNLSGLVASLLMLGEGEKAKMPFRICKPAA